MGTEAAAFFFFLHAEHDLVTSGLVADGDNAIAIADSRQSRVIGLLLSAMERPSFSHVVLAISGFVAGVGILRIELDLSIGMTT